MKRRYLIIGIISILIMMIGVSYAYFTSMIVGEGSPITVKAKKLAIIFTDTEEIADSVINPGWSTSKTFTIENKSGSVFYYDINIEDLINTFVTEGYLQYKITSNDGGYNMEGYMDIPKSEEAKKEILKSGIEIEDNEIHTYTIEFRYLNSEEDQSEDMGKVFDGRLSITESEILVVKYRVNGIIQDEMPSKEIPYIVGGVECTNNAKGVWNEETETVELETPVKQTVCIVEFGEGYTVSMLTEHGEVVSPVSKVVGRIGSTTFNIEEKEGYTLEDAAIVCDNGGEGSLEGNTITISNIKQNNTCTVITNPIEITVTYNVNGGNALSPTNKTVIYTGTYGSLPIPSRTGYTFSGWYTSATSGSKIEESTEVTSTVNHTIYAHWNSNTINLTLNNQSATTAGSTAVYYKYNTATYYSNSALSTTITKITVPSRTGYTFGGYYTAASGGGTQYINASGAFVNNPHTALKTNTTLYAKWTVNTYTVTYNQNGGSGVSPASNTVTYNTKYKLPTTNPTRAGFTFANWWTAASGGTQVTTNTTLTNASNHSIYAHWNPNTITLTLNNQSATSAGSTNVYYRYNTATYYSNSGLSTTITKITVPTRTGYTFGGYYTAVNGGGTQYINASGSFVNNPYTAIKANTTLYAKWTINSYNVTVTVNNGRVTTTNPLPINYGGSGTFTIAANSGYKLDGATVSCSGGTYNQAGTLTVSNVTSARTCTITLVQDKATFTINSACPDEVNDNSSPCYMIFHSLRYTDWDGTALYNGKTYRNCKIDSYTMGFGGTTCSNYPFTNVFDLVWNTSRKYWNGTVDGKTGGAKCSVVLSCDPA